MAEETSMAEFTEDKLIEETLNWDQQPLAQPYPPGCGNNTCLAGHTWPLSVQVGRCPGCQEPILAVRQENCPVCNEPSVKLVLRVDHVPARGGQFIGACRGASAPWGVHSVIIEREPVPPEPAAAAGAPANA